MQGLIIVLLALPICIPAQVIPHKAVFYNPARASFVAELADDIGPSPTPREAAILTLDNNFGRIRNDLRANAVIIVLADEDGFHGQFGGGWSYDPCNRPKPQTSVAQEIILAIAHKYDLKVIFLIGFSGYHRWVNDAFGSSGSNRPSGCSSNPLGPPGAYDFIHHLVDPPVFYGTLCTTKLELVGLPVSCTRSYYNDTARVAGWYFQGEWCVSGTTACPPSIPDRERIFINKYWNFFYNLVHFNPAQAGFAGIYAFASPDNGKSPVDQPDVINDELKSRITELKGLFCPPPPATCPEGSNKPPDQIGFEWYGNACGRIEDGLCIVYPLANVAADLRTVAGWMIGEPNPWPASKIALMEGGSNQIFCALPARTQFFTDAVNTAARIDGTNPAAGISVWNSDGYSNLAHCMSGALAFQNNWALFNAVYTPIGCKTYPPPSVGWHLYDPESKVCIQPPCNPANETNDACWCVRSESFGAQYGRFDFISLRPIGISTANAFASH